MLYLQHAAFLSIPVALELLPQSGLALLLLHDQLLLLGDQVLHALQLLVDLLALRVRVGQPVLHHCDVLLQAVEVIGQHC